MGLGEPLEVRMHEGMAELPGPVGAEVEEDHPIPVRDGVEAVEPGGLHELEPGQQITVEWRGKPVWILNRTPEMLDTIRKNANADFLVDPESKGAEQPAYVKGPERSIKPEIFVATGVCTHLGCSPTLKKEVGAASDMGADWPGGYYCPCHNSRFDLSARVFKGSPAPTNLKIPPHRYASDTLLVIGEDTQGA